MPTITENLQIVNDSPNLSRQIDMAVQEKEYLFDQAVRHLSLAEGYLRQKERVCAWLRELEGQIPAGGAA